MRSSSLVLLGSVVLLALVLSAPLSLRVGAASPNGDGTVHYPGADVRAAFARGAALLENDAYKIHASRRTAAGQAEVHTRDTDLIYVLEGSATFVTGGTVLEPAEVAAGEIRGSAIQGGTTREIRPGDVVVVPNGTPHWFQAVRGPVLYYVVKVTAGVQG